jgi:hypothetical protein
MKPRAEYKTFPARIVSMGSGPELPGQDPYADLADLSLPELKAYAAATIKHLGIDPRPAPEIVTFPVE